MTIDFSTYAQEMRADAPPRWSMMGGVVHPDMCLDFVMECEAIGFQHGSYSDGSKRDNVSVLFIKRDEADTPVKQLIFDKIDWLADIGAELHGVEITPGAMDSIQVSKWQEGDYYGSHQDTDTSRVTLDHDRKLTVYIALTDGGGFDFTSFSNPEGYVGCNAGNAMMFNGLLYHAAPVQKKCTRYSVIGWIPGPRWR